MRVTIPATLADDRRRVRPVVLAGVASAPATAQVGAVLPFLGVDSWRWQYFENQPCPEDLVIPIDDATAWQIFPDHRWVYNKLSICESQGVPHGPHGTEPPRFPVFS